MKRTEITPADVFGIDEALAYVNERLPEERRLSAPGFRRHVFDDPARPGSLFQLEPIALGQRVYADRERATALVFTRRMLDEYLSNRANNARRCAERVVTRPTGEERAALMGRGAARLWLNDWFSVRRLPFRISESSMNDYQATGRIPHKIIGQTAAFLTRDVEMFAHEFARQWRGRMRPAAGRPPKQHAKSARRARRAPAK